MIDHSSLFKINYGLYLVASGTEDQGNAFVSNTVFQVSSEPPLFASCCSKDNHSAELIRRTGAFSVSVLKQEAGPKVISLGYTSGRDRNKMEGLSIRTGVTGVPVILDDALAVMEFRVREVQDVGSHLMFIAELVLAETLDETAVPLTYSWYREVKKAAAPKNAPTYIAKEKLGKTPAVQKERYECPACGYIYDDAKQEVAFKDLPEDWVCPICGEEKSEFIKL